jgi:hypothetical protein
MRSPSVIPSGARSAESRDLHLGPRYRFLDSLRSLGMTPLGAPLLSIHDPKAVVLNVKRGWARVTATERRI